MKRAFVLFIILAFVLSMLGSCSDEAKRDKDKIDLVFTSFAPYDWTREIIKGKEDLFCLTLINDNGSDIHNYQPTIDDIIIIEEADLFVYNGGESENWIKDIDTDAVCVSMIEAAGVTNKGHEHAHTLCEDEHPGEEHVWLSILYAIDISEAIKNEITKLDPDNESIYSSNYELYRESLGDLYSIDGLDAFSEVEGTRVVFADRYPFYYMMRDFDIEVISAFEGCSTESNADIDTQLMLAGELKDNDVGAVLVCENSDRRIAESVIAQSGKKDCKILEMNSMQSVTDDDIKAGMNYYDVMQKNLSAVFYALY